MLFVLFLLPFIPFALVLVLAYFLQSAFPDDESITFWVDNFFVLMWWIYAIFSIAFLWYVLSLGV